MVYLPPPQYATASRPSYAEAYANILKAHRQSPLTSAASVIILVAPDVDALCAARMLADLFKQDDVMYRIIPVSGVTELERIRDELIVVSELHTLILLNMGAILDLPSDEWFGGFSTKIICPSLFGGGEAGDRIVVWDDGGAEELQEERKAWEALTYEPLPDSDDENSDSDSEGEPERDEENEDDEDYEQRSGKRRSLGDGDRAAGKRQRVDKERPQRMTRDQHEIYSARLEKHYMAGTWHGQSAAGTIYILATVLERVDNDLLWLAILGLTYQYTTSRISRAFYEIYHAVYHDEVFRLNPPPPTGENAMISLNPDDLSVRATEELRFMLFRHWTLYDAMLHSSYVASKLGIWKERGRKKLTGLLAKMGFSLLQTQQPYSHMDMDLKKTLVTKLNEIAPLYGLVELSYPSFMRCFGYRSQPLSAADAVEGISALLDVAGGLRMEIEVEGARNGGEWFGGGKVWEATNSARDSGRRKREERENIPPAGGQGNTAAAKPKRIGEGEEADADAEGTKDVQWWVKNFWTAFDALTDIGPLRRALNLSMTVHRAIIEQGTSIIDKQDIRTMRNHRVVVLTQGPHLALFSHPGVLSRLALWLVDALRDRLPGTHLSARSKRKSLPFVVACLDESMQSYIVVGVMAALDFGDVRKNEFGLAFLDAKERCNARTRHGSFDTSVLEINQEDLKVFLETLCEGPDA
ncbi:CDC45-like protein [Mycena galericulata]|nr:CDC45-like protein [Mycena galericulata]